ncbi:putative small intestine urate exporter [Rhynchocyon petersi]
MGITIPAMVNHTASLNHPDASTMVNHTASPNHPAASTGCHSQDDCNGTPKEFQAVAPVYDWSPDVQGIILGSINYGIFLTTIPTGYVAGVFGAKRVVGAGLFISSVMTLFTPVAAGTGLTLLIAIRVLQGIAQIMVLTGQYSVWVKWAPPMERSQLVTIATSGFPLGIFIVFATGGVLCQNIGWPYVFYISGGIGCVYCLLWFSLVYDNPVNHPFISNGEKAYIICALAQQNSSPSWYLPIKPMITSLPLWAILVSHFCEFWFLNILMTFIPTYINFIFQANLRMSGILSALPPIFGFVSTILGGLLADFLLSRKILRLATIRKLFTAIGSIVPSLHMVSLHWVRSSPSTAVTFLVLSSVFNSFSASGSFVNFLDIAPRYTSFIKGLSEILANIGGAISVTTTGFFLSQDSELGWRNIFLLSAAIKIFGLIIYLIFGKADIQDWAKEQSATRL